MRAVINPTGAESGFRYTLPRWASVDVGKSADSKPQFRLNHFDGEVSAVFSPNVAGIFAPVRMGDAVVFDGDAVGFEFRQAATKTPFNEVGGFDLEITLKSRPQSNILTWGYDSNLKPYHQPPLTAKEIAEGFSRPEHVVNSIAWYHPSKGGLVTPGDAARGITTGKAFHLYAQQMVDALGKTAWAGWFLNGSSEIQLILNEKLLAEGQYPILVRPVGDTFGYGSNGVSAVDLENQIWQGRYVIGADGTGVSLHAYITATTAAKNFKGNIYDNGTGDADTSTNLIANGATEERSILSAIDWQAFNFIAAPSFVNGTSYRLAIWAEAGDGLAQGRYDTGEGIAKRDPEVYGETWPDPSAIVGTAANRFSIYVTYSTGGGGWTHISTVNGIASTSISTFKGIAVASISKIMGVAV